MILQGQEGQVGERIPGPIVNLHGSCAVDNGLLKGAQRYLRRQQDRPQSLEEEAGL